VIHCTHRAASRTIVVDHAITDLYRCEDNVKQHT
jgi:hypothetical protein